MQTAYRHEVLRRSRRHKWFKRFKVQSEMTIILGDRQHHPTNIMNELVRLNRRLTIREIAEK